MDKVLINGTWVTQAEFFEKHSPANDLWHDQIYFTALKDTVSIIEIEVSDAFIWKRCWDIDYII